MKTSHSRLWSPLVILVLLALSALLFALLVLKTAAGGDEPSHNIAQQSAQRFHWKLVTTWPKRFPGLGLAPENFAKLVSDMSNGRLQIEVFGANEIVPALGVFGAVSSGSVEMGHGAAYYWKGKILAAPLFTAIPFGMNAQEYNGWLHYGGGLELWREVYAPFNLIPFAGGNTGVQMGGWFNKEIHSIADIQGLKMRIPGLGGDVFAKAGGVAVNIPGGELYTSLQSGVIDATEWVGPYNDLAFGFHKIAKYYYYPGWHETGPELEFIVNAQAFAKLPEDLKKIIEVAARAVNQDMLDEYTARNISALHELVNTHGVDIRPFPDDVMRVFKTTAFELYDTMAAQDPQFAKVYASYKKFLDGAREAHRISEESYYRLRSTLMKSDSASGP